MPNPTVPAAATGLPAEISVLDKARALGVALPTFRMHDAPELFAAWADRVALADSQRHAGRLTDAALDECDRQLGIPASWQASRGSAISTPFSLSDEALATFDIPAARSAAGGGR